jgi:hypothetical protein
VLLSLVAFEFVFFFFYQFFCLPFFPGRALWYRVIVCCDCVCCLSVGVLGLWTGTRMFSLLGHWQTLRKRALLGAAQALGVVQDAKGRGPA